jgi:hypothetical protein
VRDGAATSGGPRRLGLAGFCATAVALGPARDGYGLFLPEIREEFGLSTEVLSFIAPPEDAVTRDPVKSLPCSTG